MVKGLVQLGKNIINYFHEAESVRGIPVTMLITVPVSSQEAAPPTRQAALRKGLGLMPNPPTAYKRFPSSKLMV